MSSTETSAPQDPTSHLLETLRINTEALKINTETLKLNAEALKSDAETLKINTIGLKVTAEALAHLAFRGPELPRTAEHASPSHTTVPAEPVRPKPEFILNERVGSITTAEWEALDENRIAELKEAIHKMIDAVRIQCWDSTGIMVQRQLEVFGFKLKTRLECTNIKGTDWDQISRKPGVTLKSRFDLLSNIQIKSYPETWYFFEMLRVLDILVQHLEPSE